MFIRCATLCCSAVNHLGALNCFRLYFSSKFPTSNSARLAALLFADHCDIDLVLSVASPFRFAIRDRRNLRPTTTPYQPRREVDMTSCDIICINAS